jgi:hypothetical protein
VPYCLQLFWILKCVLHLQTDAEKMCSVFKAASLEQNCKPNSIQCGLCGGPTHFFNILSSETDSDKGKTGFGDLDLATIRKVTNLGVN